jgi:hypothetical protein
MRAEMNKMYRCFYRGGLQLEKSDHFSVDNTSAKLYVSRATAIDVTVKGVSVIGRNTTDTIELALVSNVYGIIHMNGRVAVFKVGRVRAPIARILDDLKKIPSSRNYIIAILEADSVVNYYKKVLDIILGDSGVGDIAALAFKTKKLKALGLAMS